MSIKLTEMCKMNLKSPQAPTATIRQNLVIETAINELEVSMAELIDALVLLAERMEPLLGPEEETKCCAYPDRVGGDSVVSERILCNSERAREASERLRNLTGRL